MEDSQPSPCLQNCEECIHAFQLTVNVSFEMIQFCPLHIFFSQTFFFPPLFFLILYMWISVCLLYRFMDMNFSISLQTVYRQWIRIFGRFDFGCSATSVALVIYYCVGFHLFSSWMCGSCSFAGFEQCTPVLGKPSQVWTSMHTVLLWNSHNIPFEYLGALF